MILYRPASIEELPAAYAYVDDFFGPGITPYDDVLEMQRKNDLFINIVTDKEKVSSLTDVFGYFSLIPLNIEAHERVRSTIFYGKDMKAEHMVGKREWADALYLGAIASKTHKPQSLRAMFKTIDAYSISDQTPVYTRPVSEDGHRLCKKLGFKPVAPEPDKDGFQMFMKIAPLL